MALDGVITHTQRTNEGVRITLGPRPAHDYVAHDGDIATSPESIPGQPQMLIVGATFEPHVGDQIWGSANSAKIESGGISFPYRREGYGKLVEEWPKAAPAQAKASA